MPALVLRNSSGEVLRNSSGEALALEVPAIARVQIASPLRTQNSNNVTTYSFNSDVTAGSLLTLQIVNYPSAISSITDNQGNTWQLAVSRGDDSFNFADIWYAENAAAGPTTISIFPISTGFNYLSAILQEWEGVATSGALDAIGDSNGSTTSTSTATTVADTLVLLSVVADVGVNPTGYQAPTGDPSAWTLDDTAQDSTTDSGFLAAHYIASTTGTQTATGWNPLVTASDSVIAAFKAAAGGGGGGDFDGASTETAAAADTQAATMAATATRAETAAATDAPTAVLASTATRAETTAATDSTASTTAAAASTAETAATSDVFTGSAAGNYVAAVAETAGATDAAGETATANQAVAETVTASDAPASTAAASQAVAETTATGDSTNALPDGEYVANLSDTLEASDSLQGVSDNVPETLDARFIGAGNVKFKPLKKEPPKRELPLAADITNLPDAPPAPSRKDLGVMAALAMNLPLPEEPAPEPAPTPPVLKKAAPAPLHPAPEPAPAPVHPEPPKAAGIDLDLLVSLATKIVDGRQDLLQKELDDVRAEVERLRAELHQKDVQRRADEVYERIRTRREQNEARTKEIVTKFMQSH
jgi:hypothetical protein